MAEPALIEWFGLALTDEAAVNFSEVKEWLSENDSKAEVEWVKVAEHGAYAPFPHTIWFSSEDSRLLFKIVFNGIYRGELIRERLNEER